MAHLSDNTKARYDYEFLKRFTAGLKLLGHEVKSVRNGRMSLAGSHISVRGAETFLIGADIAPYQPKNTPLDYDSRRTRKLLLDKSEIEELGKAEETKGLTIVPISVYNKGRFLKLDLAIARGKRRFDKRETIKKRDTEREISRRL